MPTPTVAQVHQPNALSKPTRTAPMTEAEFLRLLRQTVEEMLSGIGGDKSKPVTKSEPVVDIEKAVNVIDRLISSIHREFTVQADLMYGDGIYGQDERKLLSHAIGEALDTFNEIIDAELPQLRTVNPWPQTDHVEATMFAKSADEEQVGYAIAYPAKPDDWSDSQGDWMSEIEIAKMAHAWMTDSQNYDIQHQILDVAKSEAHIVESFIAPIDIAWPLPDGSTKLVTKGSWVVATKFGPTLWPRVKSGLLKAYSIRGKGVRKVKQVIN